EDRLMSAMQRVAIERTSVRRVAKKARQRDVRRIRMCRIGADLASTPLHEIVDLPPQGLRRAGINDVLRDWRYIGRHRLRCSLDLVLLRHFGWGGEIFERLHRAAG